MKALTAAQPTDLFRCPSGVWDHCRWTWVAAVGLRDAAHLVRDQDAAGADLSFCVTFYVLDSRNVRSKFHIGIG